MRLWPLTIAAGSLLSLPALALVQEAAPTAVAPTAAPVPSTIDEGAKAALAASAEAIKNLPPVTFTAKSQTSGSGLTLGGTIKVKLIRGKDGTGHSYQIDGTYAAPGLAHDTKPDGKDAGFTTILGANIQDQFVQWLQATDDVRKDKDGKDVVLYKAKTLVERPIRSAEPGISKATIASETFKEVFLPQSPFVQELGATSIVFDKPQTIDGEDCLVVRATMNQGKIERVIAISAIDKLPRRYEQGVLDKGKRTLTRTYEFTGFNMDKPLTIEDIKIKLPAGYTLDRKTDADYPQPAKPQPAAAAPPAGKPATLPPLTGLGKEPEGVLLARMKEIQTALKDENLTPEARAKLDEELAQTRVAYSKIITGRKRAEAEKGQPQGDRPEGPLSNPEDPVNIPAEAPTEQK
jgi:hypothetical protein